MPEYVLSPYIHLIESHLDPENLRSACFHQLTGDVFEPPADLREVLWSTREGKQIVIDPVEMSTKGDAGQLILDLIDTHFLIKPSSDPIEALWDYSVVRPIQNPALSYRSENGELVVVRLSMASRMCSPAPGQTPSPTEEVLSRPAADILLNANGSLTLRELFDKCQIAADEGKHAVEFLSDPERQLIKLARPNHDLDDPDQVFNAVPRNLYHSARWQSTDPTGSPSIDFHTGGIEDAEWEFDFIEPTVNHAFRFPSAALGGLEYGARFYEATLTNSGLGVNRVSDLNLLEVGAGTGTFAQSFIHHASKMGDSNGVKINYHILELSEVLAASQKKRLSTSAATVEHFHQNAVAFEIPHRKFDLIIANEVAADFPTALVERQSTDESEQARWMGEGAIYLERYGLFVEEWRQSFRINAGAFEFVERAWEHLNPGGRVILTEYGAADLFPVQILHLNHDEFSIHFGHVKACAEKVGFTCELLSLADFLSIDEHELMLAGTEEHIICLNHILDRFDRRVPYAALSKTDFQMQFGPALESIEVSGPRFLPLSRGFYFGPRIDEFMVLIMKKPL